ncbi:MAG: type III pantothenate kinase [Flavobacteriales bacterium]|nr:type III pantothenate kinase [Flavobacteriales bacterium]
MDLIIDIGNSRTKLGIFVNSGIQTVERYVNDDQNLIAKLRTLEADRTIVSSVRGWSSEFASAIRSVKPVLYLDHTTPIPVRNSYGSPDTLGKDRLAAVVGAAFLHPNANCLAIDAGTCITYDLITAECEYLGGNISPGLEMRAKAMHEFTGALPLVRDYDEQDLIGRTTQQAISSGILNGLIREVNGTIEAYREQYPDLKVILCGGEARYLVNQLKGEIFANRNLVLIGLHKILQHNDN